jgi:hypothetical protein
MGGSKLPCRGPVASHNALSILSGGTSRGVNAAVNDQGMSLRSAGVETWSMLLWTYTFKADIGQICLLKGALY